MRKWVNISLYMRRPLVIYDFATPPLWISLYMKKIWFSFLSVWRWPWSSLSTKPIFKKLSTAVKRNRLIKFTDYILFSTVIFPCSSTLVFSAYFFIFPLLTDASPQRLWRKAAHSCISWVRPPLAAKARQGLGGKLLLMYISIYFFLFSWVISWYCSLYNPLYYYSNLLMWLQLSLQLKLPRFFLLSIVKLCWGKTLAWWSATVGHRLTNTNMQKITVLRKQLVIY